MERVTGKRLPQLVSEELWQKMGAEESACFTVDSAGFALADGGLNATMRDYGRFGQLILENGGGVIPAAWIEATRNGNHGIFNEPYTFHCRRGLQKPVLDRGSEVAGHYGAGRVRANDLCELGLQHGGGEAVELAGFLSDRPSLTLRRFERDSCDREGVWS